MFVSVLINNYNYEEFVYECIESVLKQTYQDFEIIIVDDGSTDKSLEIINSFDDARIKIISKKNGGQLSAFNEGIKLALGDVLFFLDADDKYEPNYLGEAMAFYGAAPDCDFLYVGSKFFGSKDGSSSSGETRTDGYTYFSTLYNRKWVGSVTSAVSVKRTVIQKLFPLESIESDWITRADDCLVWGSSLLGAKKYYLDKFLVLYRVHNSNNFHGKSFDESYCYKREISVSKFFNLVLAKLDISDTPNLFLIEYFSTKKSFSKFVEYFKILLNAKISPYTKITILLRMILKNGIRFNQC